MREKFSQKQVDPLISLTYSFCTCFFHYWLYCFVSRGSPSVMSTVGLTRAACLVCATCRMLSYMVFLFFCQWIYCSIILFSWWWDFWGKCKYSVQFFKVLISVQFYLKDKHLFWFEKWGYSGWEKDSFLRDFFFLFLCLFCC